MRPWVLQVTGTRKWIPRNVCKKEWDRLVIERGCLPSILITGMATGVDSYGWDWAKAYGVEPIEFPADWKKYNKAAGPIRNREMVKKCEELKQEYEVVVSGVLVSGSRGTRDMLLVCASKGFLCNVTHYSELNKRSLTNEILPTPGNYGVMEMEILIDQLEQDNR